MEWLCFGDSDFVGSVIHFELRLEERHMHGSMAIREDCSVGDWVNRFNAQGLEGLRDAPGGHPKKRLTPLQEGAVKAHVLKGPDPVCSCRRKTSGNISDKMPSQTGPVKPATIS
jgi:Homeodomain-like domain